MTAAAGGDQVLAALDLVALAVALVGFLVVCWIVARDLWR